MNTKFFESVENVEEADIEHLLANGETHQVLLALEYWRFLGEWDRVANSVAVHRESLPASCELYLAEYDCLHSGRFDSDHIPVANTNLCQSLINSLEARNRYYFSGPQTRHSNTQKRRKQIREWRQIAPGREVLWDVLYAKTLKVRSQRDAERVYDLCRPAIRAGEKGLEEYELCGVASTIAFNAAIAARDVQTMQKTLALLFERGDLRASDDASAVFVNLRASEMPSYDCSTNDTLGTQYTIAHLSRLYRDLCRGEELNGHLDELTEQLCHREFRAPVAEARLSIYLSPLTFPHAATVNEDDLCDLIRSHQGSLKDLNQTGQRLAAMCHAVGGIASVGLGPGETNNDIRQLATSIEAFWAYRGLAYRIIRSNQSHLIPRALDLLSKAYGTSGWTPQTNDPLHLWLYGTEPFIDRIEAVIQWAMNHEEDDSFNQAMADIVLPMLIELPSADDEDEPFEYSPRAKELVIALVQSDRLNLDPMHLETLYIAISAMCIGVAPILQVFDAWLERLGRQEVFQQKLVFVLTDAAETLLPPRHALDLLASKRGIFDAEELQESIQETVDVLQEQLAASTHPVDHFMLFDPSLPADRRSDLGQATLSEILQLGAACSYLETPNGQGMLPYSTVNGNFTIETDGWPPILKSLLQTRLLQIRPDSPEGAFELESDGALSWYPGKVDLAVNVYVEGAPGKSQAGILMSLPALIRQQVTSRSANELLVLWRSLVRKEAHEYFLRCLEYFNLPAEPAPGDAEVFQSACETFPLDQLMNLVYNSCRSAAGDQKARRLNLRHARNRAQNILKSRLLNAQEESWEITPGFRGDLMPTPYLVHYFATEFLPMGESTYEKRTPNLAAVETAQLTSSTGV